MAPIVQTADGTLVKHRMNAHKQNIFSFQASVIKKTSQNKRVVAETVTDLKKISPYSKSIRATNSISESL